MGIKQYKPTSAGRRGGSVSDFADCTYPRENRPEKSLLVPVKKKGGRNNQGIITARFRGGGHKRMLRLIDILQPTGKTIEALNKGLSLPPGVDIKIRVLGAGG